MDSLDDYKERLKAAEGDSESYHSVFDDILEEIVAEHDPKLMDALTKLYEDSDQSRWYA